MSASKKVSELPALNTLTGDELFYCAKGGFDRSVRFDVMAAGGGGGGGGVNGLPPTTDNAVVRWNGTSGNSIQNSVVTIADAGYTNITPTGSAQPAVYVQGSPCLDGDLQALVYVDSVSFSTQFNEAAVFIHPRFGDHPGVSGEKAGLWVQGENTDNQSTSASVAAQFKMFSGTPGQLTMNTWGIVSEVNQQPGTDGFCVCAELGMFNYGGSQPQTGLPNSKYIIKVIADTGMTTAGIHFSQNPAIGHQGVMHYGIIAGYESIDPSGGYFINYNGTNGDFVVDRVSNLTSGPNHTIYNKTAPLPGTVTGSIDYVAPSTVVGARYYGGMQMRVQDPTDLSEDSRLLFWARNAGTSVNIATFDGSFVQFNDSVFIEAATTTDPTLAVEGNVSPSVRFGPSAGATQHGWLYQSGDVLAVSNDFMDFAQIDLNSGATNFTHRTTDGVATLADGGGSIALDATLANTFTLAAAGNRTIAAPTNPKDGQKIVIRHLASGGVRTLTLTGGAGGFRFGTDIPGLTSTASGKTDYIGAIYSANDNVWDVVAYARGY